jgi:hypothetical protein
VTDRVILLVGTDAAALGEVARDLGDGGIRTAVFIGDVTDPAVRDALHEFADELFPVEGS